MEPEARWRVPLQNTVRRAEQRQGRSVILVQTSFGGSTMCDYSLAHFPNRLAVEGEQLVVHRFDTGTLGLVPAAGRSFKEILFRSRPPAVCVPPGAQLRLRDIPEHMQRRYAVGPVEGVTFVQKSAEAFIHRDAVRFSNGQDILLQRLQCGQRVDVQSLCALEEVIEPQDVPISAAAIL